MGFLVLDASSDLGIFAGLAGAASLDGASTTGADAGLAMVVVWL